MTIGFNVQDISITSQGRGDEIVSVGGDLLRGDSHAVWL